MKKTIITLFAFAAATASLATASELRLKVPFSFTAGSASLPAGDYTVQASGGAFLIRGDSGAAFFILAGTRAGSIANKGSFVFGRTEKGYILKSINPSDGSATSAK